MNKSVDNKEESSYRRTKERKSTENHKEQLKNVGQEKSKGVN
jgi:hypothetical protein